jgi:hypothetical protein
MTRKPERERLGEKIRVRERKGGGGSKRGRSRNYTRACLGV